MLALCGLILANRLGRAGRRNSRRVSALEARMRGALFHAHTLSRSRLRPRLRPRLRTHSVCARVRACNQCIRFCSALLLSMLVMLADVDHAKPVKGVLSPPTRAHLLSRLIADRTPAEYPAPSLMSPSIMDA